MNSRFLPFVAAVTAIVSFLAGLAPAPAAAAGPAASSAAPGGNDLQQEFGQDDYIPAQITLVPAQGGAAAEAAGALGDKAPLRVRFAGQARDIDCVLHTPKPGEKIAPGVTAIVSLRCMTRFRMFNHDFGFSAFDKSGRHVGDGTLRP